MGKRGRKRKQAIRTDNGRVTRAGELDVRAVVLAQPHRRWLPSRLRKDQRAENALGRLFLAGVLTEGQVLAGEKFRRLMLEYGSVIDTPRLPPTIMARMSDEKAGRQGFIEVTEESAPIAYSTETEEDRRTRVLSAVTRAKDEIRARDETGRSWRDLNIVVMDDQEPRDIMYLNIALNTLASLWRTVDDGYRRIRGISDCENHWGHDEHILEIQYSD